MRIIGYKTLSRNAQASLDSEVNNHLEFGWQPFGRQNCQVVTNTSGEFIWADYSQVLVKYEEPK